MNAKILAQTTDPDPAMRRQAIIALGRSGDPRALEVLARVYRDDPDPALRELARRAGLHIRQAQQNPGYAAAVENAAPPAVAAPEPPERKPISRRDKDRAQSYFSRALDLHVQGDKPKALQALSKALAIDPALADDTPTTTLASQITGLPPAEAVASLLEQDRRCARDKAAPRQRQPLTGRQQVTRVLLVIALIVLIVAAIWFVQSGLLDRYRLAIQVAQWSSNVRQLSQPPNTEYYLVVPDGEPPPDGWPVVVAFHGYGGSGDSMVPLAATFIPQGVMLIAPSFGNYAPNPGNGPLGPMSRILDEVGAQHPVDPRGVILFGFSQGGSFAYRYSVYEDYRVAGVVTAGAPEFDAGLMPARHDLPYVFTWGAQDGLQEFVLPSVYDMDARGYDVDWAVVHDAGHEITAYSLERATQMINSVYGR